MTWSSEGLFVKVCGLGTEADVDAAAEAGANAVGLVWWERSPRHLPLDRIAVLADRSSATTVLVTVGIEPSRLLAAAARAGVAAVQPHGAWAAEAAAAATAAGLAVIRPLRPGHATGVDPRHLILLDTPDDELPGGTGRPFDWNMIGDLERPYLLAGGLTPETVAEAVARMRPFGVDASSGLESSPGVKDPDLIRRFVAEARQA